MGVGQLIDKLFGGESGKNETVLRAYGKLPFYAEYRRLEVAPGAPTLFSQWMDAGRLAWVRSPTKSETGTTRSTRMLINLPDSKETIVACLWDSRDSLGRIFPFAFFVVSSPENLGGDSIERWVTASSIHRRFEQLYAKLHSLGSGGDFYRLYRKHIIPLRPDDLSARATALRDDAARIVADAWFEALALGEGIAPGNWFAGLQHRSRSWKTHHDTLAQMAISCPLAHQVSIDSQTVIWLEWLDALSQKSAKMYSVLLPLDGKQHAAALNLIVRDLLPDDYQLLTTDERSYGFVERLATLPDGDAALEHTDQLAPTDTVLSWLKKQLL